MTGRKTRKHQQFTIEEKNKIVKAYLTGESGGYKSIARKLDISDSVILRWIRQYREFGTAVDRRGKATKETHPKKGRPKRPIKLENMTREQLIEQLQVYEDIKKQVAYLRKQKKNIK